MERRGEREGGTNKTKLPFKSEKKRERKKGTLNIRKGNLPTCLNPISFRMQKKFNNRM